MTQRRTPGWGSLLCLGLMISCQDPGATPSPVQTQVEAGPSLLEDARWQRAFRQLSAQAGPDAYVLEFDVHPDRIVLKARDPRAKTKVLQHTYRGGRVEAPVPVRLLGTGTLEDNLFPMSEVDWNRVPAVAQEALGAVDPEGSISHVLIRRNLPHDTQIRMRAYVSSPIRDGYVDADAQGKILAGP